MKRLLRQAEQKGANITMIYQSRAGVVSKRTIRIISYTDGYLIGYCYLRRQIRTFKTDCVLAIEPYKNKMEAFVG